jgi:hypothetical protein
VVEKILKARTVDGTKELLTKWKGYEEPTWEPEETIKEDVPEMIKKFQQRKRSSRSYFFLSAFGSLLSPPAFFSRGVLSRELPVPSSQFLPGLLPSWTSQEGRRRTGYYQ